MPMSNDVSLPVGVRPDWPPFCVKCRAVDPSAFYVFTPQRSGWLAMLPGSSWIVRHDPVVAPACPACATRMGRTRLIGSVLSWVLLFIALFAALVVLRWAGVSATWRPWLALAVAFVCFMPLTIWHLFHPPPVNVTVVGRSRVDYEFADMAYAFMFAGRNVDHMLNK
jgi:hypothetical protein